MPISYPLITSTILGANNAVGVAGQKILVVAGKTSAGSATSGNLYQNVSLDTITALFGARSMARAIVEYIKKVNPYTPVDVIPLSENGAGSASAGVIAFTGTSATESKSINVTIGSETYELPIVSGETPTQIGDKLVALLDAKAQYGLVNTTGSVAITASYKGTEGNDFPIIVDGEVAGITITLTAMTGGAGNPTMTGVFDVVAGIRYQTVVHPSTWALTEITNVLEARFPCDNKILDGVVINTKVDTHANILSALNALNKKTVVTLCVHKIATSVKKSGAVPMIPSLISAVFAGIRALRFTENKPISNYVVAKSALDTIGGAGSASLPYFNTPIPYCGVVGVGETMEQSEIDEIAEAGGIPLDNNINNTALLIGDAVTTYKTDSAGNDDVSFKYLNYVDTMSVIREYFFNNLKSKYAQSRLTEGDLVEGRSMANETSIRGFCTKLFVDLSKKEYVLTQAGNNALKYFKQNLDVTLDLANRKVTISMVTPIVTQLGIIIMPIQVAFTTEGGI